MNKQAKQVLINKGLVKQAEQIFKGKYEIAILALKPGKRVSFELAAIEKDLESALETKKQLDDKAFMTRLLLKSKGNKYKATYLSDFNDVVCLTKGLNRTLEINIKQLRDKLSPRKNARKNYNLEMTGYMGFGYSQANCLYVCTRLYDTIDEAAQHINKRYSIDLDTVEILDVSRLSDGSFRFSKATYDNMKRLKHVKLSKLIDKFGREEAYAMMEELEQQRQEIYNETETAKKLAKTVGKELIIDEYAELTFSYIDNALKFPNIHTRTMIVINRILRIIAFLTLTLPEAIGLLHFVLCILSLSLSFISLIIYIVLAKREKHINPNKQVRILFLSKNIPLKSNGKKTKKFFI